jgi:hypothetical protein
VVSVMFKRLCRWYFHGLELNVLVSELGFSFHSGGVIVLIKKL